MLDSESNDGKILQDSEVQKFYENSVIFITGGSGFIGQLLIEKLLRSCSNISKIFILLREKKGRSLEERLENIQKDEIFDRLLRCAPNAFSKIHILQGDCSLPDLGLSPEDKELLIKEVNIIIHAAATVKLDEKLSNAIPINLRATRDLLQIALQMKQLKSFLHVSTAFSFIPYDEIYERVHEVPISAKELLLLFETLNKTLLDKMNSVFTGMFQNSYVLTKAVAESLVNEMRDELPIAIIRPSIVISTMEEPIPGWCNNSYGINGIVVPAAMGIMRTFCCFNNNTAFAVPADSVINAIIVAAAKVEDPRNTTLNHRSTNNENNTTKQESRELKIYNFTCSEKNSLTYGKIFQLSRNEFLKVPPLGCFWYYFLIVSQYTFVYEVFHFILHYIPGFLLDKFLILRGKKPRFLEIYKRTDSFTRNASRFTVKELKYEHRNIKILWNQLNNTDKKLFCFNLDNLNWNKYIFYYVRGLRKYVLKDPLETIPRAQKKYFYFKIAHYFVSFIIISIILKILHFILN